MFFLALFVVVVVGVFYLGSDLIPALVALLRSGDNSYPTKSVGVKPCYSRM